ncbi:MAG TPA: hypothetical protein VEC02_03325 [Nitrososphaerales archaeon]|nr:hypothetical protein [Nitrososphaerales archaeon]
MAIFVRFSLRFTIGSHILLVPTSLVLVVLILLSYLVCGQGVDITSGSFSILSWATARNLAFVLGTLLLGTVALAMMLSLYARVAARGPSGPDYA